MVDDVVDGDGVDDGFWRFFSMMISVMVSRLRSQGGILRLCDDTSASLFLHV